MKQAFILTSLILCFLLVVHEIWRYAKVVLYTKPHYSIITHYNRNGELYLDGVALVLFLIISFSSLVLYIKSNKSEEKGDSMKYGGLKK